MIYKFGSSSVSLVCRMWLPHLQSMVVFGCAEVC